jgi:hypothetical protein
MDKRAVIGTGIVILTAALLAAYLYYEITKNFRPKVYYASETSDGIATNTYTVVTNPSFTLGINKTTLIFWVYINELPEVETNVIAIGTAPKNAPTSDQLSQMVSFSLTPTEPYAGVISMPCNTDSCDPLLFPLKYIPVQRWFQLALSINYNIGKLIVSLDGDTVGDMDIYYTKLPNNSDIAIGTKYGFSGVVSNVGCATDLLTEGQLLEEYNKGPTSAKNLVPYGVRPPIYKL